MIESVRLLALYGSCLSFGYPNLVFLAAFPCCLKRERASVHRGFHFLHIVELHISFFGGVII